MTKKTNSLITESSIIKHISLYNILSIIFGIICVFALIVFVKLLFSIVIYNYSMSANIHSVSKLSIIITAIIIMTGFFSFITLRKSTYNQYSKLVESHNYTCYLDEKPIEISAIDIEDYEVSIDKTNKRLILEKPKSIFFVPYVPYVAPSTH